MGALVKKGRTWLEPSFGDGAFLQALHDAGIPRDRIRGVELETAESPNDKYAKTLRGQDFLSWSQSTNERFDNVIGNPPYVPIHQLQRALQRTAIGFSGRDGLQVRLSTNYWCAFVAASISLLNPKGNLAFVLPAALEYANYADPLRRQLLQLFETVELHRSCEPLFEGVQDGCVILIARGCRVGRANLVRREYSNLTTLIKGLGESQGARPASSKKRAPSQSPTKQVRKFSDIFELKIGAVTGDVEYFLMSERRRAELDIPISAVVPVVSRARHLNQSKVDGPAWTKLKKADARVWLFHPSATDLKSKGVSKYLKLPPNEGGCRKGRYKIKDREPWYSTPLPKTPHGFLSGMSTHGPWIALAKKPKLTATNTLYTVRFRMQATENERYGLCLSLLTSSVRAQIKRGGRRYAEQLFKFEPTDLAGLSLPSLPKPLPRNAATVYAAAVADLLNGREASAVQKADAFFAPRQ